MYWRSRGWNRRALPVSDQNDVQTTRLAGGGDHYKLPFNTYPFTGRRPA